MISYINLMMMRWVRRLWDHFLADNLFRNSIYLMATTSVSAALGFFFWLIATHLFPSNQIGIGTTLVSAMTLISSISLLGFNSTFVRVLPGSKNRDSEINTGSILVISAAAVMAAAYILLVPYTAPKLDVIAANVWFSFGFVVMVALASINSLTDSIFVAYRSAKYNFITDGLVTSGTKLLLPFFFVGLGAYGVFAAAGLAASMGMVVSVLILIFVFKYHPRFKVDIATLKSVFHYSFTNYIANLLSILPTLILPIMVIDRLGASAAANYYLAFMVANLIYTVSISVSQSLFAEGSYAEGDLKKLLKDSTILLAALMVPLALVLAGLGPIILGFFGKSYNAGGSDVVVMLALGAPLVAAFNIGSTVLRIRHQVYSLIVVNLFYVAAIIGSALLWINRGLVWVAIAWMIGNAIAAAIAFLSIFYHRGLPTPKTL